MIQSNQTLKRSTARRNKPNFIRPDCRTIRIKELLFARCDNKNFNRDLSLKNIREHGAKINLYYKKNGKPKIKLLAPRKNAIRLERIETLREITRFFVEYCDYSVDPNYMFEIKYSAETMAKIIGQHHQYEPSKNHRNGRGAYDCVLNALHDLEASDQIVVVRDFDWKLGINKANRIFLTSIFFKELGVKRKEMLGLMRQLKSTQDKFNKTSTFKSRELERVAEIRQQHIITKLKKIKAEFFKPKAKIKESALVIKRETKKTHNVKEAQTIKQKIAVAKANMPYFKYHKIQEEIKRLNLSFEDELKAILDALHPSPI